MTIPSSVQICECWARDGLQSWPAAIAAEDKVAVLREIAAAGVTEVDATALVPASVVPQFADAELVLAGLVELGVRARVLAPNLRGVRRAVELKERFDFIETVGFPISASEPHNLANLRRTHAQHLPEIAEMVKVSKDAGLRVLVAVATAYGCPIVGDVPESTVFGLAEELVTLGVDRLMLSDTTGLADPARAASFTARAVESFPGVEIIAHFHDTRGAGMTNTWAAISAGATCVDACLGGIGGEPASVEQNHSGETGNVSTEDLVVMLERAGVVTGVDPDRLLLAGQLASRVIGAPTRSQVQRTGHGLNGPDTPSAHSKEKA